MLHFRFLQQLSEYLHADLLLVIVNENVDFKSHTSPSWTDDKICQTVSHAGFQLKFSDRSTSKLNRLNLPDSNSEEKQSKFLLYLAAKFFEYIVCLFVFLNVLNQRPTQKWPQRKLNFHELREEISRVGRIFQ